MDLSTNTHVVGVYSLKGLKKQNKVKIKHLDNLEVTKDLHIRDTSLTTFTIDQESGILGEVFAANLTDKELMSSKKQPIIYISTFLNKPLKMATLYKIMLYFTITDEKIKSQKELLSKPLNGFFSLELIRGKESVTLDMKIDNYPGEEKMLKKLIEFTKTDDMKEIFEDLAYEEEEKIASKYKASFKYEKTPEATVNLDEYDLTDYY